MNIVTQSRQLHERRVMSVPQNTRCEPNADTIWRRTGCMLRNGKASVAYPGAALAFTDTLGSAARRSRSGR